MKDPLIERILFLFNEHYKLQVPGNNDRVLTIYSFFSQGQTDEGF